MLADNSGISIPVRVSVVLPTMNEEKNVGRLCERLLNVKQGCGQIVEAIFVLNNTTDDTERVLEDISRNGSYQFVRVVHSGRGRGSAIRRGVEVAGGDVVVVMDSDGQYDPADIPKIVRPIVQGGYCIVVGKNHGWASHSRRITSETFKKLTKILLGIEYVQTGFKAGIKEVLLDTVPAGVSGLDIDVRWMNNVVTKGYDDMMSTDVEVALHPRRYGKTTFNLLKLSLGLLYTTLSLAIQRKTGRELPFPRILKEFTLQPERESIGKCESKFFQDSVN